MPNKLFGPMIHHISLSKTPMYIQFIIYIYIYVCGHSCKYALYMQLRKLCHSGGSVNYWAYHIKERTLKLQISGKIQEECKPLYIEEKSIKMMEESTSKYKLLSFSHHLEP